jgi:hypothetical protein
VPAGGSLQESAGEIFPPLQPKPLKTWATAIVWPAAMSGLVRVNFAPPVAGMVAAIAAAASAMPAIHPLVIAALPSGR